MFFHHKLSFLLAKYHQGVYNAGERIPGGGIEDCRRAHGILGIFGIFRIFRIFGIILINKIGCRIYAA